MIRLAKPEDAAEIAAIYAPYVIENSISFELDAPDAAEIAQRMAKVLAVTPWLVYELDGCVAGYAYASPHRDRLAYQWTREVSVYIHPKYQRLGLAHKLYSHLFDMLRKQGYNNVLAGITQPNAPSVRFHESMGFSLVGIYRNIGYKLGAYHDVGWWQLFIGDATKEPQKPIDLKEIME